MKIIHCSDLHLDADLRSRFDAGSAADRRAELMNTFRRLCRQAREFHARAVLICGDLFDTDTPSLSAVRTVEEFLQKETGIRRVIFNVFKDSDLEIYQRLLT
jgi:DNA repair exonuclease SbcCD nuclease subunit